MQMLLLAIITGIISFLHYTLWVNYSISMPLRILGLLFQFLLTFLTVTAALKYKGRLTRPSYDMAGYTIWTFPFALIMLSLLGNVCIFVALCLYTIGFLTSL